LQSLKTPNDGTSTLPFFIKKTSKKQKTTARNRSHGRSSFPKLGEQHVLVPESEIRFTGKTKVFLSRGRPPDREVRQGKFLQLPDVGSHFRHLEKLKHLSPGEIAYRRATLLSLARQAKHDPKLREIMRDALVGTFVSTKYYFHVVEKYLRIHPQGLIFYYMRPRLACLERSIYQAIHQPSTYLLNLEWIQRIYLEYQAANTIVTHLCPLDCVRYGPLLKVAVQPSAEIASGLASVRDQKSELSEKP
jgi:hypothetical protein